MHLYKYSEISISTESSCKAFLPKSFAYCYSVASSTSSIMKLLSKFRNGKQEPLPPADNSGRTSGSHEKMHATYDDSPLPRLTMASFTMGVLVSMGGFIFGYDTGQVSGFLAMEDFLRRFGQWNSQTEQYFFSNVRAGLIVALVIIDSKLRKIDLV